MPVRYAYKAHNYLLGFGSSNLVLHQLQLAQQLCLLLLQSCDLPIHFFHGVTHLRQFALCKQQVPCVCQQACRGKPCEKTR